MEDDRVEGDILPSAQNRLNMVSCERLSREVGGAAGAMAGYEFLWRMHEEKDGA